jgi:hypothetical protein
MKDRPEANPEFKSSLPRPSRGELSDDSAAAPGRGWRCADLVRRVFAAGVLAHSRL